MTSEDRTCVALLFCATFGVGSMSFGSVFAATGPLLASLAVYFLSACNLHASVAVSKTMAVVPVSVRSFSDLGYFAFGESGRRVVLVSEAGVCFLTPIAFFILGGTVLLPYLFEGIGPDRSATEWIVWLAVGVLPITLIPTLKGASALCYIGSLVAIVADSICIWVSATSLEYSPRETQISPDAAVQTFGTIMFALGTAIIIPPIQRQHSDPGRLANLVSITLVIITSIYLLIGMITYYQYGCTAPSTLLDELPSGQWKRLASALMLVHVMVAFPVMLNPTLFDLERYVLEKDADIEVLRQSLALRNARVLANEGSGGKPILGSTPTVASLGADAFIYGSSTAYTAHHSPTQYSTPSSDAYQAMPHATPVTFTVRDRIFSAVIRTTTIALQAFLGIMLQSSFMDILSLIGSTAITISCMIMPCLCYLKVHPTATQEPLSRCDKTLCYTIIASSTLLGAYCTLVAAGNIHRNLSKYELFAAANTTLSAQDDAYPFCHAGERN